ncbi:heme NO-binding domain-containing protein [Acidovorax sp. LjRoot118]|uniref:heme NO-binding domain-containing protein n=1 Tax=unclassified Acidovorax TaxID=2684926 RepID=UPI00070D8C78|nr:heme NO-binding domain-containing protein [Acidovorax sp. Root217]KRC24888.1 heme NO-binding protein [Acidovorax sp. Root217]
MYGLVNQALEDFVVQGFGNSAWERIRQGAGIDHDMFIAMDGYPDDTTFKLVGAASEVLGLEAAQVLEAFGKHWVLYTAESGYGEMLAMFGSDLRAFLNNLDNLHSHVGMSFPALRPPSFTVEEIEGSAGLLLHYRSERVGLAPMVVGLLKGLGKRFSQGISVQQTAFKGADDHDIFRIDYVDVDPSLAQ